MRMLNRFLLASLLAAMGWATASAQEPFDKDQQDAIERIVREYILEHPEIIPEAIQILQAREDEARIAAMKVAVVENRDRLENDNYSGVIGNPDGAVTIVEFFDYQCPFCRRAHPDLMRVIADNPDVRVVVKQFPIKDVPNEPPVSLLAAYTAMVAAREGKFEAYHENLNAAEFPLNETKLLAAAEAAGLDRVMLQSQIQGAEVVAAVRDTYDLARTLGVSATPTFIIGNEVVIGAQGYDALMKAVNIARERRAEGAP